MLIQQNCMFSFEEIVNLQYQNQEKTLLHKVLRKLDFTELAMSLSKEREERGPKGYYAESLLRAMVAMHLEKIPTVKRLVQYLEENPALRYSCGFNQIGGVPSESTFSRFQTKLACSLELAEMFRNLVLHAKEIGIISGENLSVDSSKLGAYEASKPKNKIDNNGLSANWGMKRDTDGNNIRWFGWKIHAVCDSKSELPMEIMISPANMHDSAALEPLLTSFKSNYGHIIHPKYFTLDSGYDATKLYMLIWNKFKAYPIIALNARKSFAPPEGMNKNYQPICSAGYPLKYYGKDGNYLKFRCPDVMGDCNCFYGRGWCSPNEYGYTRKLSWKNDMRFLGYPHRGSDKWQTIYNSRTSVERMFSRHKEGLNLDNIRSRGINKARLHALLSSITLIGIALSKI